jgi:hypothetical protein
VRLDDVLDDDIGIARRQAADHGGRTHRVPVEGGGVPVAEVTLEQFEIGSGAPNSRQ